MLTQEQKKYHVQLCQDLLEQHKAGENSNPDHSISGDETMSQPGDMF